METNVTTAFIIAFFGALPPTIVAFASLMAARENGHKADYTLGKTIEIHTLTNSNLSRVTSQLELATAKVEGLERQVTMMVSQKDVADRVAETTASQGAQALSDARQSVPPGMVVVPAAVAPVADTAAPSVTAKTDTGDVIVGTFEGKPKKEAKT